MSDDAVNKTDGGAPEGSGKKPNFSPAVAGSYVFPVAERLQRLREMQNQECWAHQRPNIAKAIQMYESGELPLPECREIFFANGEVLDRLPDTITRGVYLWTEGLAYQLAQGAAVAPGGSIADLGTGTLERG